MALPTQMTIAQATGFKVEKPNGDYFFLEKYDPFNKVWTGLAWNGPAMSNDADLLALGIAIVPSPEELKVIESLRLTNKIFRLSKELTEAMNEWLGNPLAR